jgi:uncharacterized spore protein YtfJ
MAGIQIAPVKNALVVEDPVAEVADVLPAAVELGLILLRGGSVGKCASGEKRSGAGTGMGVVEKVALASVTLSCCQGVRRA